MIENPMEVPNHEKTCACITCAGLRALAYVSEQHAVHAIADWIEQQAALSEEDESSHRYEVARKTCRAMASALRDGSWRRPTSAQPPEKP